MRIILAVFLGAMLMCSTGLASPLTDYSQGKAAIDVNWRPNLDSEISHDGLDSKQGNFDWGITYGLGGNFAVQYRQFSPETKISSSADSYRFNTQEANVLYRINENVAAFAGYHRANVKNLTKGFSSENKNVLQVGLVGNKPLSDKTQLYGIIGAGKDLRSYEVGLSYRITKDTEFNLSYMDKKISNSGDVDNADVRLKGIGYGLTFKF